MSASEAVPDTVFRSIVDSTPTPFVLIDGTGTIRYASASIAKLLGWSPEELVGHSVLEYLDGEHVDIAVAGIAEAAASEAAVAAGIPALFPIRAQTGAPTWVEVAVRPVFDHPDLGLIALRLRRWDADHHLAEFMERLLADAPLPEVLSALASSVTASLYALGAAVHHGWDGERFVGVDGSWAEADELPLTGAPWADALGHDGVLLVAGDQPGAALLDATSCWLVSIEGGSLPPAVLSVWTDVDGPPLYGHRSALTTARRYVELALVRNAEHQRLHHLAGHDPLTGVANRASFREHLAHALAIGERGVAVAFCDLDGFKQLNDQHGHGAGDDVLVEVTERLRGTLRESDELARLGGDEFTILWRGIGSPTEAERVAARVVAAITEPFTVPNGSATIGISVGVAMAGPGATADDLLAAADEALYESKRRGGSTSTMHTGGTLL